MNLTKEIPAASYFEVLDLVKKRMKEDQLEPLCEDETSDEMKQEMKLASNLFLVMGFGYIFPYCALVQPVDYWKLLFPTFNIEFDISCAYNLINFLTFLFILWLGGKQWYTFRIVGGYISQMIVLSILPASYYFLHTEMQHLAMVLACSVILAVSGAFLDSSVFSLASLFPHGGIENVQIGIGFSILVTAIYRDLTKAFFPSSMVVNATMLYFFFAVLTVGMGVIAYYLLRRLRLTEQCLKATTQRGVKWSILRKILPNELFLSASYFCTLLLWPGVITAIPSFQFADLNHDGWWPLILLTVYATWNVLGRFSVRHRCGITARNIWKAVVLRFLLVPFLIGSAKRLYFTHDVWTILFVSLFGLSDGYVGTLAVVVVNDCVAQAEHSATGIFSSFFLNMGIVTGASASLLVARCLNL